LTGRETRTFAGLAASCFLFIGAPPVAGQQRPEDTEIWEPEPPVVRPGSVSESGGPPSDAIVLFGGVDLNEWVSSRDGSAASWTVSNGIVTVNKAVGHIETRRRFRDYQLHIEWQIPERISGSGQERGNSGVFLASTGPGNRGYELQILDSFGNATYVNGMAGSIYKQAVPLANPSRPPGQWQSYDIVWTAPRFEPDGSVASQARVTVFFNGALVQNDFALSGETVFIGSPYYEAHGDAPIKLQAHADPSLPISFRNIWVRELP
jgi:hypothetical protein